MGDESWKSSHGEGNHFTEASAKGWGDEGDQEPKSYPEISYSLVMGAECISSPSHQKMLKHNSNSQKIQQTPR